MARKKKPALVVVADNTYGGPGEETQRAYRQAGRLRPGTRRLSPRKGTKRS